MKPRAALRRYMQQQGLSQEALARRVCVSRPAISLLLSDKGREPSLSLAFRLERVTGIPARSWAHSASASGTP